MIVSTRLYHDPIVQTIVTLSTPTDMIYQHLSGFSLLVTHKSNSIHQVTHSCMQILPFEKASTTMGNIAIICVRDGNESLNQKQKLEYMNECMVYQLTVIHTTWFNIHSLCTLKKVNSQKYKCRAWTGEHGLSVLGFSPIWEKVFKICRDWWCNEWNFIRKICLYSINI